MAEDNKKNLQGDITKINEVNNEAALDDLLETESIADNILEAEEEIAQEKEFIKEEEIKVEGKVFYYTKTILSGVLDQILAIGLALIIFTVFDLILRAFGLYIAMKQEMFLVVYIISNMLYYPLVQEMLHGKTLGRKIMFR